MELLQEAQRQWHALGQCLWRGLRHLPALQQRQAQHLRAGLCLVAFRHQAQAQQAQQAAAGLGVQRPRAQVSFLEPAACQQRIQDAAFGIVGNGCSERVHVTLLSIGPTLAVKP